MFWQLLEIVVQGLANLSGVFVVAVALATLRFHFNECNDIDVDTATLQ